MNDGSQKFIDKLTKWLKYFIFCKELYGSVIGEELFANRFYDYHAQLDKIFKKVF